MKKCILITMALLLSLSLLTYKFYNEDSIEEVPTKNIKQSSMLSLMLETEYESGQYKISSSSSWPTTGYKFNKELSKCENGGSLSWDGTNKQVVFSGNISDKCYVYFDAIMPIFLADYIISQYTGIQGENGIYYHDSTLTNGAGDNSYRYAGADVNNFICLGSSEATCPADNLYRIIGVFGDNNHGLINQQLVKVIKNISIGNLAWDSLASNDWANASLNQTLNSTFITDELSEIKDKIVEVTWKVSGHNTSGVTAKTFYTVEITNTTKTHKNKIALMYVSDYGFAATPDYWTTNLNSYNSAAKNKDWLFIGDYEYFLSPDSSDAYGIWSMAGTGSVLNYVTESNAVRPSFYLNQSVQYISGSGQESDPIRIN